MLSNISIISIRQIHKCTYNFETTALMEVILMIMILVNTSDKQDMNRSEDMSLISLEQYLYKCLLFQKIPLSMEIFQFIVFNS